MRWQLVVATAILGLIPSLVAASETWPKFRGPDGTGVAGNPGLPDRWSATENIAWKTDIPGRGWSCPIVWGDRVFITTAVNSAATPAARKGLYFGGEQSKPPETEHQWKVYCLDLKTGEIVWEQTAHQGTPKTTLHIKNTYASETPVTDGERIYVLFGNVGIFCYDLAGKPIWQKLVEPRRMQAGWGTAASPALHGDRLFLVNDNQEQSYLQARDARTGEEIWNVKRDEKSNWATPFVWQNDRRTEIVTAGTKKMRSYDLDGNLLWELAGASAITIGTPYAADGLLFLSSGYVLDPKRPMFAVRPGARGDITLPNDQNSSEFIAWCDRTAAPYNPSSLVYNDRLYVLYDMGLFACFDARTGREIYGGGKKKIRIPNGRSCTASPWAYNGKVFCLNEYAETFVIEAGADELKILHTNSLGDDETALATPAIAGDRLLIRTAERVYCVRQSK
jgi:outer membrane protein assembly factor BamB